MALSSDELNYLIYRYLLESGFIHSGFTFAHESLVTKSSVHGTEVPPGALISFVQKGLQYAEMESHVHEDGSESVCDAPFSVLAPHACRVKGKRKLFEMALPTMSHLEIAPSQVVVAKGHNAVISAIHFLPNSKNYLSASVDGTLRLWADSTTNAVFDPKSEEEPRDKALLSFDTDSNGGFIAAGSYSGMLNLWNVSTKALVFRSKVGSSPVSLIKFTSAGLAVCFMDGSLVVYSTESVDSGNPAKIHEVVAHRGPIWDIVSLNNMLVTGGADGVISLWSYSFEMGNVEVKMKSVVAHDRDVTSLSLHQNFLASGSEDNSLKVFLLKSDELVCVSEKRDHGRGVCCVRWNIPTEKESLKLASASMDGTVKLYSFSDSHVLTQLYTLSDFSFPVVSMEFTAGYLCCLSHDRVNLYEVAESTGKLWKVRNGTCGFNDIVVKDGNILVSLANHTIEKISLL